MFSSDIPGLWRMSAGELYTLIDGGRERERRRARSDELLAYNTAALVIAAVHSPGTFPREPEEAFRRERAGDGGKADFMEIARQLNARLSRKMGVKNEL